MKKLLCILVIALVLLCALISCESTEGTDSTKETEGTVATSVLDGKEEDTPGKVPSEGALSDMGIISTGTIEDCYPVLDCGRYYGADFKNVSDKSYFRIIETHKELSELTEKGALFPKSLFDNSIILALYRKEGCEDVGRIGYSNFKLVNGKASICLDAWDADYMLVDAMEWTEIVYLQIPAGIVSGTKIIGGPISISRQETKVFDTVQINADITAIESGRASLVAADQ